MSDNNKDGFYGIIVGTVERVRPYSKGQVVTVAALLNPNNKYPDRVTVWAGDDAPAEGTRVKVSGQVSWKAETYNDKPRAQVSLNFPKWELLGAAQSAPVQSAGDSWNTPGTYGDETPF
jgi:hypothetical protein